VSLPSLLLIAVYLVILVAITKPLGIYMARVFGGERTFLSPILQPVEGLIYRLCRVDPVVEQRWTAYAVSMLLFSLVGMLVLYLLMRVQGVLPLNPQGFGGVAPDLAFNTAASFTTNTNWQSYVPETTMSYLTQMAGLAFHNFVSAATGIAVAVALVRGLARRSGETIGNFWVDLVRATLYVLLPVSIVLALVFVWQGVPQNFNHYVTATTVEGGSQTIAQGAVASQEAIKMLGTNGGGYLNANSVHPYENPNIWTSFLQVLAIFAIPSGLTYTFGRMVGNTREGWAIWGAMAVLFIAGLAVTIPVEQSGNPLFAKAGVDQQNTALQAGGNFEGKETRFGITPSMLFTIITTDASCGAVNNMHDSLLPLTGLVPLFNIQSGEVIFGGVGAGLMVGRTPEYLGKKIESFEMKMAMLVVLVLAASILIFSALASATKVGTEAILNPGPHGLSEMVYAFSSGTGNNGSAFAGLSANTPFYNVTIGLATLIGRFLMIVPVLAIAGSMVRKQRVPASLGTFPTTGGLFVGMLVGTVVIVGALTFFPAWALGPIIEHLLLAAGHVF
jgi:K+-transporting ATPase ATPase A chain